MNSLPDPRLADIILPFSEKNIEDAGIIIIGVPTDEGVKRNGGRIGAAQAPDEIRRQLLKLTPVASTGSLSKLKIADFGNITGATLEEIHSKAQDATASFIEKEKIVIAIGGGHDITYPLVSGFYQGIGKRDFRLVNIDAHLDVREKKNGLHHSGSSFRLLLEEKIVKPHLFSEFGIQSFSAAESHIEWLKELGAEIFFYDEITAPVAALFSPAKSEIPFYFSFDIDSIRSNDAPGSSAPSPIGLRAEDALQICYHAGLHPNTQMLDIAEVNPLFDLDSRTTKLAARMIAMFLSGIAAR